MKNISKLLITACINGGGIGSLFLQPLYAYTIPTPSVKPTINCSTFASNVVATQNAIESHQQIYVNAVDKIDSTISQGLPTLTAAGYNTTKVTQDLQTLQTMLQQEQKDFVVLSNDLIQTENDKCAGNTRAYTQDVIIDQKQLAIVQRDVAQTAAFCTTTLKPDVLALLSQHS